MSDSAMLALADVQRRMGTVVRVGVVAELDAAKAVVRVRVGDTLSDWSSWLTHRAGADRSWWAPSVGEQVLVLAVGADASQVVVLPGLYSADHPAPSANAAQHLHVYADGTTASYRSDTHEWLLDLGSASVRANKTEVVLRVGVSSLRVHGGGVQIVGTLDVTGDVSLGAAVTNAGTDISNTHAHGGVTPGGGNTGAPV